MGAGLLFLCYEIEKGLKRSTVEVVGWAEERTKKKGKTASPGNSMPHAKTAQKKLKTELERENQ